MTDIRVAREVVTPPFQRPALSDIIREDARRMRKAAADMAASFFTPDPVLAVRIGRSHYVELYRWKL